jgi:hypothetical protein
MGVGDRWHQKRAVENLLTVATADRDIDEAARELSTRGLRMAHVRDGIASEASQLCGEVDALQAKTRAAQARWLALQRGFLIWHVSMGREISGEAYAMPEFPLTARPSESPLPNWFSLLVG